MNLTNGALKFYISQYYVLIFGLSWQKSYENLFLFKEGFIGYEKNLF